MGEEGEEEGEERNRETECEEDTGLERPGASGEPPEAYWICLGGLSIFIFGENQTISSQSFKHQMKMNVVAASSGPPGRHFLTSWGFPRASLGHIGKHFGAFLGLPEASWGPLGGTRVI